MDNYYIKKLQKTKKKLEVIIKVIDVHLDHFQEEYENDSSIRDCLEKLILKSMEGVGKDV